MAEQERCPGENTGATNRQGERSHRHDQALAGSSAASWHEESHGDWDDHSDATSAAQEVPQSYGSIDGAAVLDQIVAWLRRFIRVTFDRDYQLLALWILHTYLAVECYTTPRLQLDSLVPGAGKTTVLDHLKRLAYNPIQIASLSSPALLPRLLNNGIRTILLDEVHRTLRADKPGVSDLVAIINTGYRRGATRPVNVHVKGRGWEIADMPTFAPVALAGNNPILEDDTRSRMIRVLLMPDHDGSVEDSDWEYLEEDAKVLQHKIALWTDSARETVTGMHVEVPAGCVGRSKEKWRPLKRIAVAAGGRWPEIADELIRNGLQEDAAAREAGLNKQPPEVVLLTDLHAVWPNSGHFMPSTELVDLLVGHNPSYWGDNGVYGSRLTETRLGHIIKRATNSTSIRVGKGPRGYTRAAVQIAWDRLHVGHIDLAGAASADSGNPANPANPEREFGQPAFDDAGLTEFSGCTGLHKGGTGLDDAIAPTEAPIVGGDVGKDFDTLTDELLTKSSAPQPQTAIINGHARPSARPDRKPDFGYGFCECGDMSGPPLVDRETGLCRPCWERAPIRTSAS